MVLWRSHHFCGPPIAISYRFPAGDQAASWRSLSGCRARIPAGVGRCQQRPAFNYRGMPARTPSRQARMPTPRDAPPARLISALIYSKFTLNSLSGSCCLLARSTIFIRNSRDSNPMAMRRWGRAFVLLSLLICLLVVSAQARFEIRDSQLRRDDEVFVVRGVVYSSVPIRRAWSDTMTAAGCRYARDFPLIAALGANTIRTLAMVPAGDRHFQTLLADNGLYWLAGFPLDRFHDPVADTLTRHFGGPRLARANSRGVCCLCGRLARGSPAHRFRFRR